MRDIITPSFLFEHRFHDLNFPREFSFDDDDFGHIPQSCEDTCERWRGILDYRIDRHAGTGMICFADGGEATLALLRRGLATEGNAFSEAATLDYWDRFFSSCAPTTVLVIARDHLRGTDPDWIDEPWAKRVKFYFEMSKHKIFKFKIGEIDWGATTRFWSSNSNTFMFFENAPALFEQGEKGKEVFSSIAMPKLLEMSDCKFEKVRKSILNKKDDSYLGVKEAVLVALFTRANR